MANPKFLTKLKRNNDIAPGKASEWHRTENSVQFLEHLIKDIDILSDNVQVVESIPSMWARANLFEAAILRYKYTDNTNRSDENTVDEILIGEWRGLLALLAFADLLQFELSTIPVDFNNDMSLQIYKNQVPRNSLATDLDWYSIEILAYKHKPFAIASPTTLICTGTDYGNVLDKEIKWFDGKRLIDPSKILSELHCRLLANWLYNLKTNISNYENIIADSKLFTSMKEMLNGYIYDLGYSDQNFKDNNNSSSNEALICNSIYQYATSSLEYADNRSDIQLRNAKTQEITNVLLYADKMFNRDDAHVMIYGATTLDILKKKPSDEISVSAIGNRGLGRYELYRGEDWLFNDEVYLIDSEKMHSDYNSDRPLCWKINDKTKHVMIVYPFKEAVLDYINIDYIKKNIKVETIQENNEIKLKVRLTLELSAGRQEFTKIYSKEKVNTFLNVPLAAIWPAYDLGNCWNTYYFYNNRPYITNEYNDFSFVPQNATKIRFPSEKLANDLRFAQNKIPTEVYTTSSFPEVLLVKYNGVDAGFIGMVKPIMTLSEHQTMEGGCKVGIDFGTCSSTVFYSTEKDPKPTLLKYTPHLKPITKSTFEYLFWNDFLPYDSTSPSEAIIDRYFHTIFRYYKSDPQDAIVDGNIYFSFQAIKDTLELGFGGIADNLKWAQDGSISAVCAKAFLEQIFIQTLLQLITLGIDIKKIHWMVSYPTALSELQAETFNSSTKNKIQDCYKKILNYTKDECRTIRYTTMTESIAAARFFLGTNQGLSTNLTGGFISVDIGGGTTDISFWKNRQNKGNYVYQTSVKFASRSLFVDPLKNCKNSEYILTALGLKDGNKNSTKEISTEEIELSLSKNKDAYEKLDGIAEDMDIKSFIERISFGVSGLFYFIGMLLKRLKENNEIVDFSPTIYFGGNGSNIFNWFCHGSTFEDNSMRSKLFKEMVKKGSGINEPVSINMSNKPKAEAAGGMVFQEVAIDANENMSQSDIIVGESFVSDMGEEVKWNEVISESIKEKFTEVTSLDNVKDFITCYNNAYKELYKKNIDVIRYDNNIHKQLASAVSSAIVDMNNKKEWNKPIFLTAIELILKDTRIDLIQL